jgi:hypothetical protein
MFASFILQSGLVVITPVRNCRQGIVVFNASCHVSVEIIFLANTVSFSLLPLIHEFNSGRTNIVHSAIIWTEVILEIPMVLT